MNGPQRSPLVSVIIPCFAQGHFLRAAIDSVFAQSYREFEVIVINDGAPDTALIEEVLSAYAHRIRYIKQPNSGLSGARNAGLAIARGEFVVCLDSDDRLLPAALEAGLNVFHMDPALGLVWGFNTLIDAQGEPVDVGPRLQGRDGSYAALLVENTIGPPVGVMFRRSVLMAAGAFSTDLQHSEDYEAYLRIVRTHRSFCHGQVIAEYRLHSGNMSKNLAGMYIGCLKALELQRPFVRDNPALRRAWHRGLRNTREQYDADPRIQRLKDQLTDGDVVAALLSSVGIFLRYPRKFVRVTSRGLLKLSRAKSRQKAATVP